MAEETTTRHCIGSKRFGIEAHEAPVGDFPKQPSQRDGLGRMCREHWNAYTKALARDAMARKAAEAGDADTTSPEEASAVAAAPVPAKERRRAEPGSATGAEAEGGAG